jgi:DcmR-like sensory protein
MINNEHKDYINSSNNVSRIIEDIRRTDFHEHNMLIYPDLLTFRQIYSECTRQALDNNEVVFLATTYDSVDRIEDALRSKRISVESEMNNGNLIIVDAVKAYQLDTSGAMNLGKSLVTSATRDGKAGVFNISDMGSFFLAERKDTVMDYERSVPKKMDFRFKAICSYHKGDFGKLTGEQQNAVALCHNTVMKAKN